MNFFQTLVSFNDGYFARRNNTSKVTTKFYFKKKNGQ